MMKKRSGFNVEKLISWDDFLFFVVNFIINYNLVKFLLI